MKVTVRVNDLVYEVEVGDLRSRPIRATIGEDVFDVWPETSSAITSEVFQNAKKDSGIIPEKGSKPAPPKADLALSEETRDAPGASVSIVRAPIPGVITSINVYPGSEVTFGQELFKLEAMKMNNSIRATRNGRIASVFVNTGQTVSHNENIMEYEK